MNDEAATHNTASAAIARQIPALDGLRALAILLVIPHNVDVLTGKLTPFEYPAALLMHSGWVGVQLFFVLSGFLITGNLLDTRGSSRYFSNFFGRRALRILPLYFAMLCAVFVIAPLLLPIPEELRETSSQQVWLWTFLCNWVQPYQGSVYGLSHFWSLAVEEQFYLLWPLLVWRATPELLLRVCGVATLGAILARVILAARHAPPEAIYMFTICRVDALALGAAGAALLRIPSTSAWLSGHTRRVAFIAALILIGVAPGTHGFAVYNIGSQLLGYTLIALAFALVVSLAGLPAGGVVGAALRPMSWPPLRLIGRYSYGMYVFHLPLHVFVGTPLLSRWVAVITPPIAIAYAVAVTAASFAVAALSYELFERHFLRLKSRLTYKPSSVPRLDPKGS